MSPNEIKFQTFLKWSGTTSLEPQNFAGVILQASVR